MWPCSAPVQAVKGKSFISISGGKHELSAWPCASSGGVSSEDKGARGCGGKPGAAEGTRGQHLTAIVRCGSRDGGAPVVMAFCKGFSHEVPKYRGQKSHQAQPYSPAGQSFVLSVPPLWPSWSLESTPWGTELTHVSHSSEQVRHHGFLPSLPLPSMLTPCSENDALKT